MVRRMLLAELLASDSTMVVQNKHFDWPIMHLDLSRLLGNLLALKLKINSPVRNEHTLVQFFDYKLTLDSWL